MQRTTPTVWAVGGSRQPRADLEGAREGPAIVVDSAAWFAWLAADTTTSFAYALFDPRVGYVRGFLTVRKERRARGGSYWVAYRRSEGHLWKHYLGAARGLTRVALETVGAAALAVSDDRATKGGVTTPNQPEHTPLLEP